jgi:anthrone oxygenase-like protein
LIQAAKRVTIHADSATMRATGPTMQPGLLALVFAAAFSGSALYLNVVEQPARLGLDASALLSEWRISDRRGFVLLATLALIAAILALAAYFETHDVRWLIGALIVMASWPYTYFAIVPITNRILELTTQDAAQMRDSVRTWGLLEIGQTAIGIVACLVFIWAL